MPTLNNLHASRTTGDHMALTFDSSGVFRFDPEQYTRTYGYDTNGNLTSESITVKGKTFTKTYGYTGSNMTTESPWVKQ